MKTTATKPAPKRAYRQGARAAAAEETARRIIDAFDRRMRVDWYDEITLDQIAREAEVTVPTIIRRFGSKEGLLEATWIRHRAEIETRREVKPGDAAGAVRVVVADYEVLGDLVARVLAQEDRFPTLKVMSEYGRLHHRAWIEGVFAPWLEGLPPSERTARTDALVLALDLYTWKLVRRDMGRSTQHVRKLMLSLVEGIVGERFGAPANREKSDDGT